MMIEKRFLIEFSFQDGNNVSRHVTGNNLTIDCVKRWAEKLIENENEWVSISKIEGLFE